MSLREWFTGTDEERVLMSGAKALKGQKKLAGRRDKKTLNEGSALQSQFFRRRISTVLAGVVLAAVGSASVFPEFTCSGDQPQSPQANLKPLEIISGFTLGSWSFEFDSSASPEFRIRIRDLFQQSYPKIQDLLGEPSEMRTGTWTIHMNSANINSTSGRNGERPDRRILDFAVDASDSIAIHEFSHLFQGVDFPEINWIREGTAVALANIIPPKIGKERWDRHASSFVFGSNFLLYAGLHPAQSYDTTAKGLMNGRYLLAGRLWEEIEKSHPGSLKRFTQNMHLFYTEHSKQEADSILVGMQADDILKFFLGNVSAPPQYRNLIDPYEPEKHENVVMGSYGVNPEKGPMLFASVVRRLSDAQEEILSSRQGMLLIENPNTEAVLQLSFKTSIHGEKQFSLDGLPLKLGEASSYKVTIQVEGCRDEHLSISRRGLK